MNNKIKFNTGYELTFRPISEATISKINLKVQKDFEANNEPLEPPVYYTEQPSKDLPEGLTEPHNETTLEAIDEESGKIDEKQTEKNKKNWAAHKDALERLGNKQWEKRSKYTLLKCIQTDTTPTQEWIEGEQAFDIELPSDKQELELEYILNELLGSPKNVTQAIFKPLFLGQEGFVPNLEVEAFEDSFWGEMDTRETETKELGKPDKTSK